jgi:hypothetical protein
MPGGRTKAARAVASGTGQYTFFTLTHEEETMGKLTDILAQSEQESLRKVWDTTAEADDYDVLPSGEYTARIIAGELEKSRSRSTPGYKLTFQVLDGKYEGRRFWHDIWLTEAALPMAKRDLKKIGVTALDQLERPIPAGMRCKVKLALRKDDDGAEFNRVRRFEVVGLDKLEADEFAPTNEEGGENDW